MHHPPPELTTRVIEAVSEASGTPIEDLPPLPNSINIGAAADIVTDEPSHDVTITFAYAGMRVLIHSNATVYVSPIRDEGSTSVDKTYFDDR